MNSTIQYIEKELTDLYPKTEIQGFSKIIIEEICGWNFTDQIVKKNERISETDFEKIKEIILRLKDFEPLQYILGETHFHGLKLKVNPSVLIPRPETEELVEWILNSRLTLKSTILDIGTGSGCIALALKNHLKKAKVLGLDISEKAIEIARQNAVINDLDVEFIIADVLKWENSNWNNIDVIVSNPPYVMELEKSKMHKNVLNFEPQNALFVSDSDPLVFYRSISGFAKQHLVNKGWLFFEINESLGNEMNNLLQSFGFCDIEIRKDINGRDRMVCCRKYV